MKRWTKSARIDIEYAFILEIGSKEVVETARYESLSCMDNKVCLYASKSIDGYEIFKNKLRRLEGIVEGLWQKEEETSLKLGSRGKFPANIVKDGTVVRTKGTQG
ncbi:unnamed protein product [Prunus armeniaca]|nr:hypothetical protein GBA52_026142 [Prunus armeniaca]